jgi:hypothetical protein
MAHVTAKKDFEKMTETFQKITNKNYEDMINKNHHRYGIEGIFDYSLKPTDEFVVLGQPTFFGNGVVLEKLFITRDQVLEDMADFHLKTKKKFMANPDELRDRYIVKLYVQENMGQFVWDDKGLFENVEKGDMVAVSYDKEGILTVGYRLKGEQNANTSEGTLDMGKYKKTNRNRGGK